MLTAFQALKKSAKSAPEMPRIEELEDLYRIGCRPRRGEVIMIAGRSGSQKSGFALWLVTQWGLPTLYLAADMTLNEVSVRLACSKMGLSTREVQERLDAGGRREQEVREALSEMPIVVENGAITWHRLDTQIQSYVEIWDSFPEVIVIDNLMDVEEGASDYHAQMEIMQQLVEVARFTGATVLVCHHATDKTDGYSTDAPARKDIKNGMSEKPQMILGVSLDNYTLDFQVAVLKQRMGPQDPSGRMKAYLTAQPEVTRFHKREIIPVPRVKREDIAD